MDTPTTQTPPETAVPAEVPTPTLGGSYLVDPVTGALTLVERTKTDEE